MPIVGFLTGGINFTEYKVTLVEASANTSAVTLNICLFIQNVVDFLIISLSIFLAVNVVNKIESKINITKEEEVPQEKSVPEDIKLLTQFVIYLKKVLLIKINSILGHCNKLR